MIFVLPPNLFPLYAESFEVVVAIDVLRASSVICTAFQYGVNKIIPVSSINEAYDYLKKGYHVAAERNGEIVSGFNLGNSPRSYMNDNLIGQTLVLTTTNGTKAINVTDVSKLLLIGSFLNLDALCDYLIDLNKNVLLLGSGWQQSFAWKILFVQEP